MEVSSMKFHLFWIDKNWKNGRTANNYNLKARIPGGMIEVIEEIDGKQVKKWEMPEKFWTNKSTIL